MDNLAFEHGGNIYRMQSIYKRKFIDFSANINPLGLPCRTKKTIYENFERILHYPDVEAGEIASKIARYWGVNKENILIGNGSAQLIYLIAFAFKPRTSLIPVPTFCEYERAARAVKSRIRFLKLKEKDGFELDLSRIGDSGMLFICNPNNPTGNIILNDYRAIYRLPSKFIVIDEAFMDFLPDEKRHTLIWKAQKDKKIIVLRTFTKFFALPGLRIGYIIAHKDIISRLKQCHPPWSVNSLAQLAAESLMADKGYIKQSITVIGKERRFLFSQISRLKKLHPYSSLINFLLIKIKDKKLTSSLLRKKLVSRGILIRDCSNFRGLTNKFIRVAVRSHRENLRLIEALKEAI